MAPDSLYYSHLIEAIKIPKHTKHNIRSKTNTDVRHLSMPHFPPHGQRRGIVGDLTKRG